MHPRVLSAGILAEIVAACAAVSVRAESRNLIVVELFTSQGCSSCPPADAILAKLAKKDDVLPLALHVDYWDYIGWKDSFARPEHTKRQKTYAHLAGSRMIYTPQMVVNGEAHIVGTRPMELADLLANERAETPVTDLDVERKGDGVLISATAVEAPDGTILVQLVRYMPEQDVEIDDGENAGRTISYTNIVTDWDVVAKWAGDTPLSVEAATPGPDEAAVILQAADTGRILAAPRRLTAR